MKIKEFDYVSLRGITEEQYHAVAKVFMDAGADAGEYPYYQYNKVSCRFGIVGGSLYHSAWNSDKSSILDGKELSIEDMLSPAPNFWDGNGEPEVGQHVKVELFTIDREEYPEISKFDKSEVKIVGKFEFDCALGLVIYHKLYGHKSITNWGRHIKPIKSEREIAIEDIQRLIRSDHFGKSTSEHLYDAGYRKVEATK